MRRACTLLSLASLLCLSGCHDESLLSGLTESQVNGVVAVLQQHGVTADKRSLGKGLFEVDVAHADFPAAVDLARTYDLPQPSDIPISQAFPADSLISTPLAEHARLISFVEQRLSNNVSALDHVIRARVNVSYPLSGEIDASQRMHVAVLVVYSGDVDKDSLISDVKRYVKNSFHEIDYDDISVVAEPGTPVFRTPPPNVDMQTDWIRLGTRTAAAIGIIALLAALAFYFASEPWVPRKLRNLSKKRMMPRRLIKRFSTEQERVEPEVK